MSPSNERRVPARQSQHALQRGPRIAHRRRADVDTGNIRLQHQDAVRRSRNTPGSPARVAFTLIELLVVVAIIAVLAAVVAPSVFRNVGDAKQSAARSQIELFATALNQYRLDNDAYPTTEQGIGALRVLPSGGEPPRNWRGPYLSRVVPLDPWGRPYVYISPGVENPQSYDLYSLGRDGKIGGDGEDSDVTSWGGAVRQ